MKAITQEEKDLKKKCKQFGIETNIATRWSKGTEHHPRSVMIMNKLICIDWLFNNDAFCWKIGGDGDSGEELMYEMDIIFELEDKQNLAK